MSGIRRRGGGGGGGRLRRGVAAVVALSSQPITLASRTFPRSLHVTQIKQIIRLKFN
jgi:hypothetical protein